MQWRTVRKYLYSVLLAAGPIISFYGLASGEEIALWVGLGGTILAVPGSTTALANLSSPHDEPKMTFDVSDAPDGPKHADV